MGGGMHRHPGLGVHGGVFCLVSRGSRARGLPGLALTARQWCGYHGVAAQTCRRGSDDVVASRAPIALSRKASASPPRFLPATQRGTCS
jgi:hypothetical protein